MINTEMKSLRAADIAVGNEVTPLDIPVTTTSVVTGAIATHDYMPMHHDKDFAKSQGSPDVFFNIMTTNAYISRFVTDWAGPEASLKNIKLKLGVQAIPGQTFKLRASVINTEVQGDECVVELMLQASVDTGDHATGTVTLTVPV